MVSAKLIALSALSAVASAKGAINGMTAPATAAVGSTVTATLNTHIYIQNWDDFGIVWGIGRQGQTCDGCVGTEIKWTNLHGPDAPEVPDSGKFTVDVALPSSFGAGTYIFYAGIPYLVGASGVTGFSYFNSTITLS